MRKRTKEKQREREREETMLSSATLTHIFYIPAEGEREKEREKMKEKERERHVTYTFRGLCLLQTCFLIISSGDRPRSVPSLSFRLFLFFNPLPPSTSPRGKKTPTTTVVVVSNFGLDAIKKRVKPRQESLSRE